MILEIYFYNFHEAEVLLLPLNKKIMHVFTSKTFF